MKKIYKGLLIAVSLTGLIAYVFQLKTEKVKSLKKSLCVEKNKSRAIINKQKLTKDTLAIKNDKTTPHLNQNDEITFYEKIKNIFDRSESAFISPELSRQYLQEINEQAKIGLNNIFKTLNSTPVSNSDVIDRLYLVDYLRYRMKFDQDTVKLVEKFILTELDQSISTHFKAAIIADKAELIGHLATLKPDKSIKVYQLLDDSVVKNSIRNELIIGLKLSNINESQINYYLSEIQTIDNLREVL